MKDDLTLGPGELGRGLPRPASSSVEACVERLRAADRAYEVANTRATSARAEDDAAEAAKGAAHKEFSEARQALITAACQPVPVPDERNAHALTLEFWRFLTKAEWETVLDQIRAHVPHHQRLAITEVRVDEQQAADALTPRNQECKATAPPRDQSFYHLDDLVDAVSRRLIERLQSQPRGLA